MSLELVSTQTEDGVQLDGLLRRPDSDRTTSLGADLVVIHHGVGGNFYRSVLYGIIQERLAAEGCAVLRVNNRGHDPVSTAAPGRRIGAAFESVDECRYDWKAWLDFAEKLGFSRLALWGQSLGALKNVYYLSTEKDSRVRWAIATSPPRFSYDSYVSTEASEEFRRTFEEAETLSKSGQGKTGLLEVQSPLPALISPDTYIEKYGSDQYNVIRHLPNVEIPILVTIGSLEGVVPGVPMWLSFSGLAADVGNLARETSNLTFELVEGANHSYTDREDVLWSTAKAWIDRVGTRASSVNLSSR